LLLGLAPLFWAPLAERYGRRPVWLVSTLLSMVANIGCARSTSYGTLMVARVFQSIFNAPAGALGTAVVAELFFARERGFKIVSPVPI
jgi:MFS family permease